jgi:hypothetical protein
MLRLLSSARFSSIVHVVLCYHSSQADVLKGEEYSNKKKMIIRIIMIITIIMMIIIIVMM